VEFPEEQQVLDVELSALGSAHQFLEAADVFLGTPPFDEGIHELAEGGAFFGVHGHFWPVPNLITLFSCGFFRRA
jgi:hypothetical protein